MSGRQKDSEVGRSGAVIGYARVSPGESNMDKQRQALESAGCTVIYQDQPNTAEADSLPGLEAALSSLRQGDTLVVWRLDRLGSSVSHLVSTMKRLAEQGIAFRTLSEGIDTEGPEGRLVYKVMAALVDCERVLLRERTRAGLQAAQEKGKTLGRPPALSEEERREVVESVVRRGEPLEVVAQRHKVHTRTIRRIVHAMTDEGGADSSR